MANTPYKRNSILVLLAVLLLTGFARAVWHPFHVSASEIEYNSKTKRLEISTKIFTDDFESVLARVYKTPVDFSNKSRKSALDELVARYITTHLSIRSNGQVQRLKFFGWEVDHEAVYVYTTADATTFSTRNITVENTILYDLFGDQVNIVHFIVNGTRKSNKLAYPERKLEIRF
ncbi:DUF6702 family protein [Niabella drilacis]|uniref:Uncharacterized protein n=1 Tax=Niabella drilacis (strain DSM 25811 / CCM 8410 / CCUG 62505 / LMG 26954 / E90) TaxID=1285928 RepID=A0A1G6T2M1_NIADE|nr:DUF6702 family protein [Niabella drilacis]SDD23104.1 hypothetical protein SAMN04487894_10765 [Niabella drilacis]